MELLPCPFCYGKRATPKLEELQTDDWRVTCYGCHIHTFPDTKERVIKDWNARHEPNKAVFGSQNGFISVKVEK